MAEKEIIFFESADKSLSLSVPFDNETVWLNRQQMASLFDRDVKTIGKHVKNAIDEELQGLPTVAKFATVQTEGERNVEREVEYYNLDVIISVGYRVKSKRGIEFRKWANSVLKQYILKGYAANDRRLEELRQTLQIIRRTESQLDTNQILSVIEQYTFALDLLDDYDHQNVKKPDGTSATYRLTYEEARKVIDSMKFGDTSSLFGNEKDDSFEGSISAVYQTFGGKDVYPSVQEKAANLLYFITKNHSFSDGNKRIAATMFLYFLNKNGLLFKNGLKQIDDNTLVALTIMIAESKPNEKDLMVNLVMHFLTD
ncbi:MAG: virulence protein RhuM/Fic/DOC family protein [Treponema sp.]|nr:virulence protein RhuM/Fic/DOC family protein [Treponema sp.]